MEKIEVYRKFFRVGLAALDIAHIVSNAFAPEFLEKSDIHKIYESANDEAQKENPDLSKLEDYLDELQKLIESESNKQHANPI